MENPQPLTKLQANVITAYTGVLITSFAEFHTFAEELLGRPIFTAEFASDRVTNELREATQEMFRALVPKEFQT